MGSSQLPVNYDFVLAQELSGLLTQAMHRLNEFGNQRANQRKKQLGVEPCEKWFGDRRTRFDEHVKSEERTLQGLVGELKSLLNAVDSATEQARGAARP